MKKTTRVMRGALCVVRRLNSLFTLHPSRLPLLSSLLPPLLFLAACNAAPVLPPTPTVEFVVETQIPTVVPTPTIVILPATPTTAPSVTPAIEPTASATPTPNVPPTPDPNERVGDAAFEENFTGETGWNWSYTEPNVVNFTRGNGQLDATMTSSTAFWRISAGPENVRVGDQQTHVTIRTNLCAENDEVGLFFRGTSTNDNKFNGYLFKITCGGLARVESLRDSQPTVLLDWKMSAAIVTGAPAENTLLVWASKGEMRFYINDRYLGTVTDTTYPEGIFGLYLRDRTNGSLSVSYTNLVAKAVQP